MHELIIYLSNGVTLKGCELKQCKTFHTNDRSMNKVVCKSALIHQCQQT